ncbi:MAG: GDSL-type esterase/lipase family protein [Phycisphaerales bacterium]|nr:GDSL-type esterase/lipase family protein [Phycisphaerales bacterium]
MILHTLAIIAVASCPLLANPHPSPQDAVAEQATPPSSQVPAARTDAGAINRETELLRRARESEPCDVLFVGDSITQAWEGPGAAIWKKHIAPLNALNLGNSGDRTENVLWRLQEAPLDRLEAKHVVLLIGTNNLGHGTSDAAETLAGVTSVAETLAEQCPDATIHVLEIFPRGERFNAMRGDICQINQALRAMVAKEHAAAKKAGRSPRFTVQPLGDSFMRPDGTISKTMMPDFLHLTPRGYEMWADAIVPVVK